MNPRDLSVQQDVVAYVLDSLDADERVVFEARLLREPGLSERVVAMRRVLKPLGAWEADEPAAGSVEAIMRRVANTTPLEYVASTSALGPVSAHESGRRGFGISLREIVAVAACILLMVGVFVPGMARRRARQTQIACGFNQAGLFRGLSQYATAFSGQLPRTAGPKNWLQQPNRMNIAPVIRMRFLSPSVTFCPSQPADIDAPAAYANPRRFLATVKVRFYSIQNLYGPVPRMTAPYAVPLVADPNPMFPNGAFDPQADPAANSSAHGGKGQNVLLLNGAVRFFKQPILQPQRDNIWEAGNTPTPTYTGTETQQSATDAFLIP